MVLCIKGILAVNKLNKVNFNGIDLYLGYMK